MKDLLLTLFIIFVSFQAAKYGSYWESQAHPIQDATIHMEQGVSFKGDLSYSWQGDYLITGKQGKTTIVNKEAIVSLSYPSTKSNHFGWRFWLAPMFLLIGLIAYLLWGLTKSIAATKGNKE